MIFFFSHAKLVVNKEKKRRLYTNCMAIIISFHFISIIILFLLNQALQYVSQYPADTSIRPLKTKTQFLRRPFQLSVNELFRMKAEHFSFKKNVMVSLQLAKQCCRRRRSVQVSKLFMPNIYAVYCAAKLVLFRNGLVICDIFKETD